MTLQPATMSSGRRQSPPKRELLGGRGPRRGSHERGLHVQLLQRLLEGQERRHPLCPTQHRVRLELILDEPPNALEHKWVKERLQYYMRCEPHAPPRWKPVGLQPRSAVSCCGGSSSVAPTSRDWPRSSRRQRRL